MLYGNVPGVEKPISRLVQGTTSVSSKELDRTHELLAAVIEQGGNAFDCAHIYGGGDPERVLGRWLKENDLREKVVILSKGCHHNGDRKRVTPYDIAADLHDSLARLQTDYVDLYVLHRDDPTVPVGPIVETLNKYKDEGKIKAFGGSNWTIDRLKEANAYAAEHGLTPFAVSSPNYTLADQIKEPWADCITISGPKNAANRAWYQEQNMPIFTWSSLAGGFFSGKMTRENKDGFNDYFFKLANEAYGSEENFQRLDRVTELAEQKGLTIPQIALAFLMNQPLNIYALVGCNTGDEYRANVQALELKLTPQELDYLDLRADSPT